MRARALPILLFVLLLGLYFARIGGFPLQDPDEGRYAEIAREMAVTGDWLTPTLHYVEYFDKPPLLYWSTAALFQIFGQSEGVARMVPAAAGVVTVCITFLLGRSMFGPRAGLMAAIMLATSPLFFLFSQALTTDMLLTACMTATLAALWRARRHPRGLLWPTLAAVFAALGVLAKGLVALVLPGGVALLFLVGMGDWAALRRLLRPTPIMAFTLVAVPWFIAVSWVNPEFVEYFFVKQHFERFSTASVGHPEGPFFYVPVLLAGALPWTAFVPGVLWRGGIRASYRKLRSEDRGFLLLWALAVLVFFSVARAKLPAYILPAFPSLALLSAGCLALVDRTDSVAAATYRSVVGLVAASVVLAVAGFVGWSFAGPLSDVLGRDRTDVLTVATTLLVAAGGLGVVGSAALVRWSRFRDSSLAPSSLRGVGTVAACTALFLFLSLGARGVVKTSRDVGRAIQALHRPGDLVISYRRLLHGLPFYSQVRAVQAMTYGELGFGQRFAADRRQFFWCDPTRIADAWRSDQRVFIATSRRFEKELGALLNLEPRVLLRDAERVVFVNFDPAREGSTGCEAGDACELPSAPRGRNGDPAVARPSFGSKGEAIPTKGDCS